MIMIRNQLAVYQLEMYGNMSDLFDLMLKNWPMAGCYFRHSNVSTNVCAQSYLGIF